MDLFQQGTSWFLCILAGYIDLELVVELIKCCVEQPLILFHTDSLDPKRFFNLGLFFKDVILPEISYAVLNTISFKRVRGTLQVYWFKLTLNFRNFALYWWTLCRSIMVDGASTWVLHIAYA